MDHHLIHNPVVVGQPEVTGKPLQVGFEVHYSDAMLLPSGPSSARPSSPLEGYYRYNDQLHVPEWYNGAAWTNASGFYSDQMARDAIGAALRNSSSISFTYNSGAGTITLAAIDSYYNTLSDARITAQKAVANGLATLDNNLKIPTSQLPALAITDTFVVASQASMLALTAQTGDVAIRTDLSKSFILTANDPTVLSNWQELLNPSNYITTVNGKTGSTVTLTTSDIAQGTNLYYTQATTKAYADTLYVPLGRQLQINGSNFDLSADRTWTIPTVIAGGTAGQVLTKIDSTDYNVHWVTPSGGGGSSTLAADTDVLITSVADGDFLQYQSSSSLWKNQAKGYYIINQNASAQSPGVFYIAGSGRIGSGDMTGMPIGSAFSAEHTFSASGTNLSGSFRGNQTAANAGGSIQGVEGYVKTSHGSGDVALCIGAVGNVEHSGAGTITGVRSIQAGGIYSGAGTISGWAAFYAQPVSITGSGTITSVYGLYLDTPSVGSGTITNRYGLYSADASAQNHVAGQLDIQPVKTATAAGTYALYSTMTTTVDTSSVFTSGQFYGAHSNRLDIIVAGNATVSSGAVHGASVNALRLWSSAAGTITQTQATGVRALSAMNCYMILTANTANVTSTVTHTAAMIIQSIQQDASPTNGWVNVTNHYQLLIQDSRENMTNTASVTSYHGIWQQGANDPNSFAGDCTFIKIANAVTENRVVLSDSNGKIFTRQKAFQSITYGTTISWDTAAKPNAVVTLTGNVTTFNISNMEDGDECTIVFVQDSTGSRTIVLPASSKVVNLGAGAITLTTTANAEDWLVVKKRGSTYYWSVAFNFS